MNTNRWILIGLCAVIAAYIFFPDFFPGKEYKPDQALIDRIDSLQQKNEELTDAILYLDSVQTSLNQQLYEVDSKIDSVKGKTTIIRKIYTQKGDNVRKITEPSQVDSFFKDRYNY